MGLAADRPTSSMPAVPRPSRWRALGLPVDNINLTQALAWAAEVITTGAGGWVATPNPEIAVAAWRDPRFAAALNQASLVLPDGIGLVWASNILGGPLSTRVTGIEFLEGCLALCAEQEWPVFLLGAATGVAAKAAARLEARFTGLQIAGVHHGYFGPDETSAVLDLIHQAQPRLLAVGMGYPRQELWLQAHMPQLPGVLGMACGGSLDVFAGEVTRAPSWVQRAGLEWLYRIGRAPGARLRRSWSLPVFAARVLRLRLRGNSL
jgi:N-acetylglucosaminyldiphosphoundecaprenol N-acetyl-beta-D-mannosaminyltransferase